MPAGVDSCYVWLHTLSAGVARNNTSQQCMCCRHRGPFGVSLPAMHQTQGRSWWQGCCRATCCTILACMAAWCVGDKQGKRSSCAARSSSTGAGDCAAGAEISRTKRAHTPIQLRAAAVLPDDIEQRTRLCNGSAGVESPRCTRQHLLSKAGPIQFAAAAWRRWTPGTGDACARPLACSSSPAWCRCWLACSLVSMPGCVAVLLELLVVCNMQQALVQLSQQIPHPLQFTALHHEVRQLPRGNVHVQGFRHSVHGGLAAHKHTWCIHAWRSGREREGDTRLTAAL